MACTPAGPNAACGRYFKLLSICGDQHAQSGEFALGWKTPEIEYVNGYKIVEVAGPSFKIYDGNRQVGDDFPYSGEAAHYANSLPKPDQTPK